MLRALQVVLCCMTLFYCFGCKVEPIQRSKWKVKVVRPDGEVHKTWIVESHWKPKVKPLWGGQIELYSDNGEGSDSFGKRYESLDLLAPAGWAFDIELSQ